MSLYDFAMLGAGLLAAAVGVPAALANRRAAKGALLLLTSLLAASAIATAVARLGWADARLAGLGLAAGVLAHPALAASTYAHLHDDRMLRRLPFLLILFLPGFGLAAVAPAWGWTLDGLYVTFPANAYLAACFAVALAEPLLALRRGARQRAAPALLLAAALFVVSGPVYSYELGALGATDALGYLPAAPAVAALGAWALRSTDAVRVRRVSPEPRRRDSWYDVPAGTLLVLRERRPKYARAVFANLLDAGAHGLAFADRAEEIRNRHAVRFAAVPIPPGRLAADRVASTVREFAAQTEDGVVYLEDIGELVATAGVENALRALRAMERCASRTRLRVMASASLLTEAEVALVRGAGFPVLALPDVEVEVASVLDQAAGGGGPLLDAYCRSASRRREDLDLADLPALERFLGESLAPLIALPADAVVRAGLAGPTESAVRALEAYRRAPLEGLARGEWPSRVAQPHAPLLVRAAPAGPAPPPRALYPELERAFVEVFGDVGQFLLGQELARLGLGPADLTSGDVERLQSRVKDLLRLMTAAVDLGAARADLDARAAALERRLAAIAGGS